MTTTDYKECRICKQEKPLSEFYTRHGGKPYSQCKDCHIAVNNYKPRDRQEAINRSEILVIDCLAKRHIPALPGKSLGFKWADVVAWGCVLIECKLSSFRNGVFSWAFTPIQQEQGLRAHLVVLCADYGHEITYHVFKAIDEIFYTRDGTRKSSVTYTPNIRYRNMVKTSLPKPVMDEHRDRWEMVETYRQYVAGLITEGNSLSDWRVK